MESLAIFGDGPVEFLLYYFRIDRKLVFFHFFDLVLIVNLSLSLVLIAGSFTENRVEYFLKFVHFFFLDVNVYVDVKVCCCVVNKGRCAAVGISNWNPHL